MNDNRNDWQARIDAQWTRLDSMPPEAFVAAIDVLASERPTDDAAALFERAAARDSTGLESGAEVLYRAALATGRLDPYRNARTVVQLASTLRILGQLEESARLLTTELDRRAQAGGEHVLHDELQATLALTRVAQGRAVEAAGLALCVLAPHLTRYKRSMLGNATEILENARASDSNATQIRALVSSWTDAIRAKEQRIFEVHDLRITAGEDVAFCHGLILRADTDDSTGLPVPLTMGLSKIDGQWTIVHEHQSPQSGAT